MPRTPSATEPPRVRAGDKPTDPLRCVWVEDIRPHEEHDAHDLGPWILIPGCSPMFNNPFAGCACDTIEGKLIAVQQQVRGQDSSIAQLKRRLRAWSLAAGEALATLRGSGQYEMCSQPANLVHAARFHRPTPVPAADKLRQDRDHLAAVLASYARSSARHAQEIDAASANVRVRELLNGRAPTDTITVAELAAAIDGDTFTPSRSRP